MNIYFLLVSACDVCFIIFLYRPASTPHIYSFIHTTQFNRCIGLRLRQSRRHGMCTNIIDVEVAVFFMVHHIPSSTSTLPTSLITRPTHIADRYDMDTSLVSLVPPPNSLRRSPTAYRCNKYQEKPYILLQRHYIIAPPYVLYQPPQQM